MRSSEGAGMRTEEQLKDAYRQIIDAITRGDAEGLDELMARRKSSITTRFRTRRRVVTGSSNGWLPRATPFLTCAGRWRISSSKAIGSLRGRRGTARTAESSWAWELPGGGSRSPPFTWCVSHKTVPSSGGARRTCWGCYSNWVQPSLPGKSRGDSTGLAIQDPAIAFAAIERTDELDLPGVEL